MTAEEAGDVGAADGQPRRGVAEQRTVRQVGVLVVGAGQAGLGTAYWLRRLGVRDVLVVDEARVGQSWLDRWDSLRLFTPRRFSRLPGRPFPSGPGRSPTREEMAAYLQAYATELEVPVETGVRVRRLSRTPHGLTADTNRGAVRAGQVVVATGPFSRPHLPAAAAGLDPSVTQMHSADYRRPDDVPPGPVLVVGGGNSAAQLAVELAGTHQVTVASPRRPDFLPEDLLGVSVYWPLWLAGVLDAPSSAHVSRWVQQRGDVIIGTQLRRLVQARQVTLVPSRVVSAQGRAVALADGRQLAVSTVLWCTGYRPDTSWLDLPGALDADGAPVHMAGASPVPGLHWMGLPWQTRLSSSIVYGADGDARRTAERIVTGL